MPKCLWFMALPALLTACGPNEDATVRPNPANRKPGYFDVKGFLDAQVAQLNQRQPAVEKQVQLRNGQTETARVAKTDWSKELQIFYQADINKPALRGAYAVTKAALPAGSRTVYQANGTADALVTQLQVDDAGGAPQAVSAFIQQDNPLFYSQKKLLLSVRDGQLAGYEVQGVQKLVFFDTVRYTVRTRVVQ